MSFARQAIKYIAAMVCSTAVVFTSLSLTAPAAQAATQVAPIHLHTSTNILDFRDSYRVPFRFNVTAHHASGKVSAGKARIYVNGQHLQTRTLYRGRAEFIVDRSRLPDNREASIKVRVIPWNQDIGHEIVTRTIKDHQPTVTDGEKVVQVATDQVGKPYQYGAGGPSSFDCSGLVSYAYKKATGKNLPHSSSAIKAEGDPVSRGAAKPGDVIYSPGHVSIYMGGSKVVEAANPRSDVRITTLWQSNPQFLRM